MFGPDLDPTTVETLHPSLLRLGLDSLHEGRQTLDPLLDVLPGLLTEGRGAPGWAWFTSRSGILKDDLTELAVTGPVNTLVLRPSRFR